MSYKVMSLVIGIVSIYIAMVLLPFANLGSVGSVMVLSFLSGLWMGVGFMATYPHEDQSKEGD